MNNYIKRAVRYFLYLIIMLTIIIGVLVLTGYSSLYLNTETLSELDLTKFYMLLAAILILSAIYPKLGYVNKTFPNVNKDKLNDEFNRIGIVKIKEIGNITYYRYGSVGRRLMVRFDDTFTIQFNDNNIVADGTRVMVVRINPQIEYSTENK